MNLVKESISWILNITLAVVVALLISTFIIQPTHVEGKSMEPTLHGGERVLINKLVHTFNIEPNYGDIVIIDSRLNKPRNLKDDMVDLLKNNVIAVAIFKKQAEEIYWIKRVIGKSGDTLEFKDGKVFRNGELIDEPYIKEAMLIYPKDKIIVPQNHIFVMGDNRNNSNDSRYIGSVQDDHIVGRYIFKF